MPLPLIPVLLGLGTVLAGGYGVKKGLDAKSDFSKASSVNKDAQNLYDKAKDRLEDVREETQQQLETLGKNKIDLYENGLLPFVQSFKQIKNIDFNDPELSTDTDLICTENDFATIEGITLELSKVLVGGATSLGGGALAGVGAFGAVGLLATASTGTAIGTLSGVAATNATLAWFGGGALAAGGLGMAGGVVVLGGVIAAPVLAVGGLLLASKAKAAVEDAYSNLAKAKAASEAMDVARTAARAIFRRVDEINDVLKELTVPFKDAVDDLKDLASYNDNFSKYSHKEKNIVRNSAALAKTVKNILETPVIDDNGAVTEKSREVLRSTRIFMEKLAAM